jgi:hypothetical protein
MKDEKEKQSTLVPSSETTAVAPIRPAEVNIGTLVVAPQPEIRVALGESNGFIDIVKRIPNINAVLWNEHGIKLMTNDRSTIISFQPEILTTAKMFFTHDEKYVMKGFFEMGPRIWEGEYAPVIFAKQKLLQFLREHSSNLPPEVLNAIKSMKYKEKTSHDEILLNEGSEDVRMVTEETSSTNLPTKFAIDMVIAENFNATLEFEAKVIDLDEYGQRGKGGKKGIQLRCTNARQVMRDLMMEIVDNLPPEIPKYYGAMEVGDEERKRNRY